MRAVQLHGNSIVVHTDLTSTACPGLLSGSLPTDEHLAQHFLLFMLFGVHLDMASVCVSCLGQQLQ